VTRHARDTGSATLWVVTAMAVVLCVTAVSGSAGIVAVERHRADAAADAAALSAAGRVLTGPGPACAAAAGIARTDGAALTRCGLDGAAAQVEVAVTLPGVLRRFGSAVGRARAGP
jgi:secretion/DNA translocation related TadE-like protein